METEITIEPILGKYRQDRFGVVVRFFYPKLVEKIYIEESSPTLKGNIFRWLPTYTQLEAIKKMLDGVEKQNEQRKT